MSLEQDPALATQSAPARRRIIVAPKLADKPIALIVRDPELQAEFENELAGARKVVVFPSLTHLCTDTLRTSWAGVVVARSCGFDVRLSGLVPDACIAFWRVAEEGYGWPSSVSHLSNGEQLRSWLEEIKKPQPLAPVLPKRVARPRAEPKRNGQHAGASRSQLKFELAVPRGVVRDEQKQMELPVLSTEAPPDRRSSAPSAPHGQPQAPSTASKRSQPATASKPRPARKERKPRTVQQLPLPGAEPRAAAMSQAARKALKRAVLAQLAGGSLRREIEFMRMAAELGLTRAHALVDGLRAHVQKLGKARSGL